MEPIKFYLLLKKGTDENSVKSELEKLAGELPLTLLFDEDLNHLKGTCHPYTYEKLFQAELKYEAKLTKNINQGTRLIQEYVEVNPAQIPAYLKDKIESVELSHDVYLTD